MISNIKKQRYKPVYKKFIRLKINVQNKLKLFKFKKQKWQKFLKFLLKHKLKQKNQRFLFYDQNLYYISKFNNLFKKKTFFNSLAKKKFSLFYGSLLANYIKKKTKIFFKKQNFLRKNSISLNYFFLSQFEKRLDIVLYRAHFFLSVLAARRVINNNHVKINNQIINCCSYILKKGDFIKLSLKIFNRINYSINRSTVWPIVPKYLKINYKTLQIFYIANLEFLNYSFNINFWANPKAIIKFYN